MDTMRKRMMRMRKRILEKIMCLSSGLYATTIWAIESNKVIRDDLLDSHT